ncbi:MAG: BlaI/MecI/CopY family transcriptional regulator [Bacteroidaceae bacterium]|jgi:predicted transcriptional regulator|nr:BlaI/MecI/CopY family transcriptional regulator [Bacteroidaceae bacterium]MBR6989225.1 BlaI/MecI/CopY family transcriptional regulator [Bacteroidaceae bacterium]
MGKSKEGYNTLTKAEMEIMNILWDLGEPASVREVIEKYPDPKPAYTTTATFLTILTKKCFVKQERKENEGKSFFYSPLISREDYTRKVMTDVKDSFFGGSAKSLVNFFCREEKLSVDEIRELLKMVEEK